jgi:hypothetical protein
MTDTYLITGLIILTIILLLSIFIAFYSYYNYKKAEDILFALKDIVVKPEQINIINMTFDEFLQEIRNGTNEDTEEATLKFAFLLDKLYHYKYTELESYFNKLLTVQLPTDDHLFILNSLKFIDASLDTLAFTEYFHYLFKKYINDNYVLSQLITILEIFNNPNFSKKFQHYEIPNKILRRRLITIHNDKKGLF